MSKNINQFSSDFKLKVVLKYLSENFTVAQICQDYKISKATLHKWVNQFKDNSSLIFNQNNISPKSNKQKALSDKEINNLYVKIGQLTIERDFLKKVLDA
jgi:transposase